MVKNVLNVAEKPKVAKAIAQVLSNGRCSTIPSKSKYNPIFSFPYTLRGEQCNMIVTSVSGHLLELDFEENARKWYAVPPVELFEAQIITKVPQRNADIDKNLQEQSNKCQWLVLWLDYDREGENISFEVISRCTLRNKNLNIFRAKFSSLVPAEIMHAANNLIYPDRKKSDAVAARTELDLRIGASFTRLQTLYLQKKIQDLKDLIISYGPCQFPTLGFVVDRYWRIEEFVQEPFWSIQVTEKRNNSIANFQWKRGRLFDYVSCFVLFEQCVNSPIAQVKTIIKKQKSKWKPQPLHTVALQKLASNKLRMDSDTVMKVAEDLYREGFISYPRTETNSFAANTDLKALIAVQNSNSIWGEYANELLAGKFSLPRNGNSNDESHPPIHPTKAADNLEGQRKNLFELITRHFLACCSEDAKGFETVVTIEIAGEIFTAKGLMVTEENYLKIYKYDKWTDKSLPVFAENEKFTPTDMQLHQGSTEPPKLLTEAELIELMDKNGIGTDATIAQHIKTIQEREYVVKEGIYFTPTTLGLALVDSYRRMGFELHKPDLRAAMEKDLQKIVNGTLQLQEVTQKTITQYRDIFEAVQRSISILGNTCREYFDTP